MEALIERWAKIPARQRYMLIALAVFAVVGGYWYFFYSDMAKKRTMLEQKYRTIESQRAEKQAYVDNLAKYEARLNELQQDLNQARSKLPDRADVAQLLAQLGNEGRQSGLTIKTFKPEGEKAEDFWAAIRFSMEVAGSYHEIGTFIDSIGKLDRIINVTDISMTNPKTQNKKIILRSEFNIKTYRFVGGNGG